MPTRLFRELSPLTSYVVVAALAIATWGLIIMPLWRFCRSRVPLSNLRKIRIAISERAIRLMSRNKSLILSISAAAVLLFIFALGFWTGIHNEARAGRVSAQAVTEAVAHPSIGPVHSRTPEPATAQPSVSPGAAIPTASPSLVDQLLREGIEFRDRGDTTNAIDRLQEALESEPNNVTALAEVAKTYDLMQLYDRANEMWRKLQEMGPSAGPAYEVADRRLKLGVPTAGTAESGSASSLADAASHKDVGGNPEGSTMGISEVKTTEAPDPDAEKNLALQIGIKKQPGTTIDHNKVKIFVKFYDTVGEKDIKQTDADVNYEWLTPKHDWTDTNPEVLSVKYLRAKTGGAASESSLSETAATVRPGHKARGKGSAADSGQRKYLGYIIQVYYNDELQAVQAEPSRLLQHFPPSKSAAEWGKESPEPSPSLVSEPAGATSSRELSVSPFAKAADFAKYAMTLRERTLVNVGPLSEPTTLHPAIQRYPWKMNIVTTVFWIGEKANYRSVWDANWRRNYGGTDNPEAGARRNYIPIAFIPKQNPFYCALPYNDVTHGQFKPEAPLVIPWFKQNYTGPGQSVCRDRWIAIRKGNRTCYAEWEDCGPFRTDHFQYVFGNERPKPNTNHGAGLSVSPAVRDYLGLAPTDVIDWQFVEVRDVPPGPWRSYGENNHFVIARQQMEQKSQQSDQNSEK